MITEITSTTWSISCAVCETVTQRTYSTHTLGNSEAIKVIETNTECPTCGSIPVFFAHGSGTMTVAGIAYNYVAQQIKTLGTLHASYTNADYTALMVGAGILDAYETIPFSDQGHDGSIHIAAAKAIKGGAWMATLILAGVPLYGTEAEVKAAINNATTDSDIRRALYKINGYAYD